MISTARVYDSLQGSGKRFLVDRLWPRGVRKEDLRLDAWCKDASPSTELRKRFGHEHSKYEEFRRAYYAELDRNPEAWKPILEAAREGPVTLLYSARDTELNNAVALKAYLEAKLRARRS